MTGVDLWLVLDGGAVVGGVAYTDPVDAEHDARALRAEAGEALGYPAEPGQIEVFGVRILAGRRYGDSPAGDGPASSATAGALTSSPSGIDPFAVPEGYRAPTTERPLRATSPPDRMYRADVDPFAPPAGYHRSANCMSSSTPARHDGSPSPEGKPPHGARRRHLTVVR